MRNRPSRWCFATALLALGFAWTSPASADGLDLARDWASPTGGVHAVQLFDPPLMPWLAGHRGIDLRAAAGDPVVAPAAGTVVVAQRIVDRGVVTIAHAGGLRSSVEPVVPGVAVGDVVSRGDLLGEVEESPGHCAPQVCVHFGVRHHGEYINPLDLLEGFGRIVLLPLGDNRGSLTYKPE